jgi:hypothetical protein
MHQQDCPLHKHLELLEPPFLPLLQPPAAQTSMVLKMKKNYVNITVLYDG